jgi:hypothetical protein
MAEPSTPDAVALRDTGRWFYRRGLPFFVADYRSDTEVWTRASGFLVGSLAVQMLVAAASFQLVGTLIGFALAFVVIAGAVIANVRRGRRWNAAPTRVTWPFLVAYVALPTLIAIVSRSTLRTVLQTAFIAFAILALTWVVTRYAVLPVVGWGVRYAIDGIGSLARLATRALPLLLLVVTFLFVNTEVWQVAGTLAAPRLWGVIALFALLGILFIVGRIPEEIGRIEAATTRAEVVEACTGTPMAGHTDGLPDLDVRVPLNRRQTANLGLVMTTAQLIPVTLFGFVVWGFFVAFGALAVSVEVQQTWLAGLASIDPLWEWTPGYGITRELLRVSLFLGAFSAFYVTIYSGVDGNYREQFYDGIRTDLERSLSVRRAYLALRRRS